MLSLRKEVQDVYGQLLKKEVSKSVSDEKILASLITAAVGGDDASALTAEVAKVSDKLKTELAALLKKGLVLKPVKDLEAGFRLVSNDGSGYLDCSDEELASIVAHFMGDINI
jgi:V/A-type H+-transporting ATPase subunit E